MTGAGRSGSSLVPWVSLLVALIVLASGCAWWDDGRSSADAAVDELAALLPDVDWDEYEVWHSCQPGEPSLHAVEANATEELFEDILRSAVDAGWSPRVLWAPSQVDLEMWQISDPRRMRNFERELPGVDSSLGLLLRDNGELRVDLIFVPAQCSEYD